MSNHLLTVIFIVLIFAHFLKIVEVGATKDENPQVQIPKPEPGPSSSGTNRSGPLYPPNPFYQPVKFNNYLFCPAEDNDRTNLEKFLLLNNKILSILFPKTFAVNEQMICKYEVEAILDRAHRNRDGTLATCGNSDLHMYNFGFQYWVGDASHYLHYMKQVISTTDSLSELGAIQAPIYSICYDITYKQVSFTRYKITAVSQTGQTFFGTSDEPSTTSFDFEKDHFLKIAQAFQTYNENKNAENLMYQQKLVPNRHMAPSNQKAINHYVNIAALWIKLVPVMKIINFGIHRADFRIKRKYQKENYDLLKTGNTTSVHELIIYTKLFYVQPSSSSQEKQKEISNDNKLKIPFVWCKFVHYRAAGQGVLIYVHNTPQTPPNEENMHCNKENRIDCDFLNWIGGEISQMDDEVRKRAVEIVKYAYCCKAQPHLIRNYFSTTEDNLTDLDIEKVAKDNIDAPNVPPPIINLNPAYSQAAQRSNMRGSGTSTAPIINAPNAPITPMMIFGNSQAVQQRSMGSGDVSGKRSVNNPNAPIPLKFKSSSQSAQQKSGETSDKGKTVETKVDMSDKSTLPSGQFDVSGKPFQESEAEPEDPWTQKRFTSKRPRLIDSDGSSDEE